MRYCYNASKVSIKLHWYWGILSIQ